MQEKQMEVSIGVLASLGTGVLMEKDFHKYHVALEFCFQQPIWVGKQMMDAIIVGREYISRQYAWLSELDADSINGDNVWDIVAELEQKHGKTAIIKPFPIEAIMQVPSLGIGDNDIVITD